MRQIDAFLHATIRRLEQLDHVAPNSRHTLSVLDTFDQAMQSPAGWSPCVSGGGGRRIAGIRKEVLYFPTRSQRELNATVNALQTFVWLDTGTFTGLLQLAVEVGFDLLLFGNPNERCIHRRIP
jgi:hypothetical protein